MKKISIILTFLLTIQQIVSAQCNVGNYTVTSNQTITSSCKITGNLTIANGATLNVNYTGTTADTFIVHGNIVLQGNGVLWVHSSAGSTNDQFIVSSSYKSQWTITTQDSSKLQLENIDFSAQEGVPAQASYDVNFNAYGKSIIYINKCTLDPKTSWILCNLYDNSTLTSYDADRVPTETYPQGSSQVHLHGTNTRNGIWMNFESITDTLNLPPNQSQPLTWGVGKIGRAHV